MAYEVVIGRSESDRRKLGLRGTIFLGKLYVKMGAITSLSNKILMDVARAHVVLVSGKRGSGKSYTLGDIAEEMCNLSEDIAENLAILILDTMGIYWTMKYPNERDADLLDEWGLKPTALKHVQVYTPAGFFEEYKKKKIPTDYKFTIRPCELTAADWCGVFGIDLTDPIGVLIERIIDDLVESKGENFDIDNIIKAIGRDTKTEKTIKYAAENRFVAAKTWGLFSKEGTPLKDIIAGGKATVLDISCYTYVSGNWSIKGLVVGMIARKLLVERMTARKFEELETIEKGFSYFVEEEVKRPTMPLVWILIDEAHEFLPREGETPSTAALVQLLREGRQPGISLVLATQQPGEIHRDVMTQSDIVISHRITARKDIDALNSIMQTYLAANIMKYLNELPRLKGSAIILDDNSERMYPMKMRPRYSWHGGEAPISVPIKRKELAELLAERVK